MHGGPLEECEDAEKDWFPQRRICWPTAQLEAVKRLYEARHEEKPFHDGQGLVWAEKPSLLTPFHFADGVTLFLSPTDDTPDDDFLGQGGPDVF